MFNENFDFGDLPEIAQAGYEYDYFAGKNVEDHILHEIAHVMTFQQCENYDQYVMLYNFLKSQYCEGVSKYSDETKNGVETLAEAFVRMRNGESVPDQIKELVETYIERWKK